VNREDARLELLARLDAAKTQAERNQSGQFATPPKLASEIVQHALSFLQCPEIRYLEPGFGTGSFFSALTASSATVQSARGFEIDPHYGKEAKRLWRGSGLRLTIGDFTKAEPPKGESAKFNLVVCNPPYVRHHHLSQAQKKELQAAVARHTGFEMNGLSGLYTYFMVLSQAWMCEGGVGAWLIPSEFMDVNYGRKVKQFLLEKVTLHEIHRCDPQEVQFDDALVSSAIVFFTNSPPPQNHKVKFTFGGSLRVPIKTDKEAAYRDNVPHRSQVSTGVLGIPIKTEFEATDPETISRQHPVLIGGLKEPKLVDVIEAERLREIPKWTGFPQNGSRLLLPRSSDTLANLFTIKRGLATGRNKFFILSAESAAQHEIPKDFLIPILPSPKDLEVNEVPADRSGNPQIKNRLFLLSCNLPENEVRSRHPALWRYLEHGMADDVHERYLCRHRTPWYSQEVRPPAPFLCTYMGRPTKRSVVPFRFILNHSNATAANVYLMLYPKPPLDAVLKREPDLMQEVWKALSSITAEMLIGEGRIYGGGLHKMEPKELANVPADVIWKVLPEGVRKVTQQKLFA
jgi:adenine-specific DNA-methyltransferase